MSIEDDILKASELSKIGIKDDEIKRLKVDVKSILAYVQKISDIKQSAGNLMGRKINIYREDEISVPRGTYTKLILESAHDTANGYIKVKKIL